VLGILALEFLLDLGITLAPEDFQIIGNLDRAMIRREHLNPKRNAAGSDTEASRRIVQILDPGGDRGRGAIVAVDDLCRAAAGAADPITP